MLSFPRALLAALPLVANFLGSNAALPQVSRQGRYLYASGSRFYIKGVAYQPPGNVSADTAENAANGGFPEPSDYIDPLADGTACARDVPNLVDLGVNTIRVYNVNPGLNHDACMNLLEQNNIYTIVDLALPLNGSINRASPSWDVGLLEEYIRGVNAFSKYGSNVLAFNIGNEVVTSPNNSQSAPFIKAAARDTKAYLKSINSGALVGYASTDGEGWRVPLANYLACGNSDVSIDLYGLNNYRPVQDNASFAASGYSTLVSDYQNYPVAAYFSEFGAMPSGGSSGDRTWSEVPSLFNSEMTAVWSGGIAFSYFTVPQGFGLTTISGNTVTKGRDFDVLKSRYAAANGTNSPSQSSAPSASVIACPAPDSNFVASSSLPPTPDDKVCQCAVNSAFSCRVTANAANRPVVVGSLLDTGCSLLGGRGGSCDPVGANGQTGVYGNFSYCRPADKLAYVFTSYYESTNRDSGSCNFAGNATINNSAPSGASAVQNAEASCLAGFSPTSTPSSVAVPSSAGGPNNGGSRPNSASSGVQFGGMQAIALSSVLAFVTFGAGMVIGA